MRINNKIISKIILEDWYRQYYNPIFRYYDHKIYLKSYNRQSYFKNKC